MAEAWKHRIVERVRRGDVDAASIIFYGAYIRFFEFAETELFRSVGLPYGVYVHGNDIRAWQLCAPHNRFRLSCRSLC